MILYVYYFLTLEKPVLIGTSFMSKRIFKCKEIKVSIFLFLPIFILILKFKTGSQRFTFTEHLY